MNVRNGRVARQAAQDACRTERVSNVVIVHGTLPVPEVVTQTLGQSSRYKSECSRELIQRFRLPGLQR
jgi:hypothetical protein